LDRSISFLVKTGSVQALFLPKNKTTEAGFFESAGFQTSWGRWLPSSLKQIPKNFQKKRYFQSSGYKTFSLDCSVLS